MRARFQPCRSRRQQFAVSSPGSAPSFGQRHGREENESALVRLWPLRRPGLASTVYLSEDVSCLIRPQLSNHSVVGSPIGYGDGPKVAAIPDQLDGQITIRLSSFDRQARPRSGDASFQHRESFFAGGSRAAVVLAGLIGWSPRDTQNPILLCLASPGCRTRITWHGRTGSR
jgi:hypothetical protein